MVFREANSTDWLAIATLHAQSWQQHYKGILSDTYLEKEVLEERKSLWKERMETSDSKRYILLVEEDNELIGLACTYLEKDPVYGALLDNLHVATKKQGFGLGRHLIQASAQWVSEQQPDSAFYLWVFEQNEKAIAFYERMGGKIVERKEEKTFGGSVAMICRVVWAIPLTLE